MRGGSIAPGEDVEVIHRGAGMPTANQHDAIEAIELVMMGYEGLLGPPMIDACQVQSSILERFIVAPRASACSHGVIAWNGPAKSTSGRLTRVPHPRRKRSPANYLTRGTRARVSRCPNMSHWLFGAALPLG